MPESKESAYLTEPKQSASTGSQAWPAHSRGCEQHGRGLCPLVNWQLHRPVVALGLWLAFCYSCGRFSEDYRLVKFSRGCNAGTLDACLRGVIVAVVSAKRATAKRRRTSVLRTWDSKLASQKKKLLPWSSQLVPELVLLVGSISPSVSQSFVHHLHHMAAAQALINKLELAGIPCKEFEECLQQACADDNCTAVLEWLTTQATENLLSDRQVALVQHCDAKDYQQPQPAESPDLDQLTLAVQREEQSKSILQACRSEQQLQEAIVEQEAKLLQLHAKLKSLQSLSTLITKQEPAAKPLQAAAAHHYVQANNRHDTNRRRLQSQQGALNKLLQDINQRVAGLQASFDPQHTSWLLSLSNLHNLHQQDAAFQLEMDRSVFQSTMQLAKLFALCWDAVVCS